MAINHDTTTAADKERTAEKRAMALALRKDGYTYENIAKLVGEQFSGAGYTPAYAAKLVKEALKSIYRDDAKEIGKMELERLDAMQLEVLAVLRANHYVISSGTIVRDYLRDEHGNIRVDASTGTPLTAAIVDDGPRLAAVDRLLKIQERRARLLGLDKPTKVAPTTPDGEKQASFVVVASEIDQKI